MTARSDGESIEDILLGHWQVFKRFPKNFYSFYRYDIPSWLRNQVFTRDLKPVEDLSEEEKSLYRKLRVQASDTSKAELLREKEERRHLKQNKDNISSIRTGSNNFSTSKTGKAATERTGAAKKEMKPFFNSPLDRIQRRFNLLINYLKKDAVKEDGVVTWNNWNWGLGDNPFEVSASNYVIQEFLSHYLDDDYESVLDLGCGYARLTPFFRRYSDKVHGFDYNQQMIERAGQAFPDIEFNQGKAQELPYIENKFELVFARSVMQHIPEKDVTEVVSLIKKVVADQGEIIIFEDLDKKDEGNENYTPRSKDFYISQFSPDFKLVESAKRRNLPFDRQEKKTLLKFKFNGDDS